jgi:aryl-alcohol dehydrogenase
MSVRWAKANGAENVIVIDPVQMRLAMALDGGADHVLAIPAAEAHDAIRDLNGGELTDIVVDTTGHPDVFPVALSLPRKYGRVALVGDVPDPSAQRLTGDVVLRGIKVTGGHMMHLENGWTDQRCHRLFLALHRAGRFPLHGLNTHKFLPDECVEAYRIANTRRGETMGIIFDWSYE